MSATAAKVLLVEDNPGDARLIREALAECRLVRLEVEHVECLGQALDRLSAGGLEAVLLDLSLPDSQGFDTFEAVLAAAGELPILVLTGLDDEELALKAMRAGAQDYLVKGSVDPRTLGRALRYAIERKQAEEHLRNLNETLHALVEASPLAIVTLDAESRVTLWSPAAERTFGWSEAEVLGQRIPVVPDDKLDEHLALRDSVLAGGRFTGIETRRRHREGLPIDLRISAAPLCDGQGRVVGVAEFLEDISDRKRAERAIKRLASMPEQSPEPLVELDLGGSALYVNQAARSLFPDLQALGSLHPVLANLAQILARIRHGERKSFSSEVRFGESIYHQLVHHVPDDNLVRVFLHDVTEQHRAKQLLEREALHDRLTRLPNRDLLLRRLEQHVRLARTVPGGPGLSVLSLDIDRLGVVNDSLGHAAGDQLLVSVAKRIAACLRAGDLVARLSGDEFGVLVSEASGLSECLKLAERIREAVGMPIEISRQELFPSVSIGIALGDGCDEAESLLRDAHIAMYHAKALGGGRHEVFDRAMRGRSLERLRLENDLRRAIDRAELKMYFQPIVRLSDGAIAGFEALVRWPHPVRGMVLPRDFIPIAEETGLIGAMTYWSLGEVCRCLRDWVLREGVTSSLAMHLNLSSRVLSDPELPERVAAVLAEAGLPGESLVLEITESALAADPDAAVAALAQVKELGVRLALDDFGTGYSSLSHLQRFPIDSLKIDRSFINKLGDQGESPEILRTILTLAERLGMAVIAEGVETEAQLGQLVAMGCGLAQGYVFARAVDREAARAMAVAPCSWAELLPGSSPARTVRLAPRAGAGGRHRFAPPPAEETA